MMPESFTIWKRMEGRMTTWHEQTFTNPFMFLPRRSRSGIGFSTYHLKYPDMPIEGLNVLFFSDCHHIAGQDRWIILRYAIGPGS